MQLFFHIPDIPVIRPKPGKCPSPTPTFCSKQLNDGCFADVECPNKQKCCDDNCGYTVCQDPVSGKNSLLI